MRRHASIRLIASILWTALVGCYPKLPNSTLGGVERFGLISAPENQSLVAAAIETARLVLANKSGVILAPGWLPRGIRVVPVFTVRRAELGRAEIMETYPECRCIIVNAGALSDWMLAEAGSSNALMEVDSRFVLAYMLLHETGHIANDSMVASRSQIPSASATAYNLDDTDQKARELGADAFAAEAIRSALSERGTNRGIAGGQIQMTLAQLSWNLTAHRMLDNFGATTLKLPSAFWDRGLSHPNFEWRILAVNNLEGASMYEARQLRVLKSPTRQRPIPFANVSLAQSAVSAWIG